MYLFSINNDKNLTKIKYTLKKIPKITLYIFNLRINIHMT